uniref:Meiotic checkpoint regulator cut4, putative n=1 Tax=Arundo donax TaxID=35708 RepID=A0A0A9G4S6_ARUDO
MKSSWSPSAPEAEDSSPGSGAGEAARAGSKRK